MAIGVFSHLSSCTVEEDIPLSQVGNTFSLSSLKIRVKNLALALFLFPFDHELDRRRIVPRTTPDGPISQTKKTVRGHGVIIALNPFKQTHSYWLSLSTETLTRQLWGVASFLAPLPPPPPPRHRVQQPIAYQNRWDPSDQSGSGDDSDGGTSDSVGISNQSEFLPFEREDPVGEAVGVTEEVLAFAMNIAHHPETWLDFPLEEEDDIDDVREHSLFNCRIDFVFLPELRYLM
ncbi:uncharacterized protein LOC130787386 [Actinidia eriantha]|uniref:uncharacterized protein LOC130787386 n=1 Tax=Actinidia eriantha TaxID=165200 RepID=UPI0025835DDB|nr:uncharacterized protein LOC130787386 [Actinidia eriantha]